MVVGVGGCGIDVWWGVLVFLVALVADGVGLLVVWLVEVDSAIRHRNVGGERREERNEGVGENRRKRVERIKKEGDCSGNGLGWKSLL